MKKIKVGVVEDEMIIAETICLALEKLNYQPCSTADSYESAIKMIEKEEPEIVLLDINLKAELDGIDLAHYINQHFKIPIIFLTANSDRGTIERSKHTLPAAFLIKPFSNDELLSAIEISMFKQEMIKESLNKSKNDLLLKAISKYDLTGREEEIILLIAKGLRQKEIAEQLFISEATVKKHLSNIYVKLNVQSSIDALNKLNLKQQ